MAKRMLLSCALRMPIEKRQPYMPVSTSRTTNIFIPSLETANSSLTTPMCRKPKVSMRTHPYHFGVVEPAGALRLPGK